MAQGEKRPVVMEAAKGVPGGVASLGADGKVPQEQLPEFGISNAEIKGNLVNDDAAVITDSQANNKTKRVFWSDIKELLGGLFVPLTRKVNNKALSSDVTLDAADVGAAERNYMRSVVVGIGAKSYTGWFRVGRIRINSTYKTGRTLLSVKGSASRGSGILDIVVRTESSAGVLNTSVSKLVWHTLTNSYMKNRFAIIVDGNYADLYLNEGGNYWYYNISVLDYMESTTDFTDPSYANIFKLERNYDLSGEYRESITPLLTSSIGFTPEIMGAATVSQINSAVSNYLPLSGGTMSGTAQVRHVAYAGQWYQGRDRALIRTTASIQNQYVPIISVKSGEGSWEIGTYQDDRLYFTYITDEAYESNNNTINQGNEGGSRNVYLDVNGNFSGKAAGLTNTLPVANGGTGKTSVGGTDYTTVRFRGSGLRNADTNPTDNGTINWTYG